MNTYVVLNPVAGNADAESINEALARAFGESGDRYQLYRTTGDENLPELVRSALSRGFARVIAAGGDGTVSGVANGVATSGVPIGIIPVGTGNALARELQIPLDLQEAVQLITGEHAVRTLDAMEVTDGSLYVLNIGIGITSLTMRDTERAHKRRFGNVAYVWTGLKKLSGLGLQPFTILVDDRRYVLRAAEVVISNAGIVGLEHFRWGPDVRPDDQTLEVCTIRARTLIDYLRVVWSLMTDGRRSNPHVSCLRASRQIAVESNRPLPVQADGEVIGRTPIQVQVVPRAVKVIVPPL